MLIAPVRLLSVRQSWVLNILYMWDELLYSWSLKILSEIMAVTQLW